jgi:D-alanyl-lipoteichoic acid acyltransferase DltB (MBOAT superfamily)
MNFATVEYFVFFGIVFLIYWRLTCRLQNLFLCAASYFFYGCWDWRFLSLIFISTLNDYICGARIHRSESPRTRKAWLIASLVINLGILGVFKYFGFFVNSLVDFASVFGVNLSEPTLHIILPVGISFYTFQTMSYSLDIYRKKFQPTPSFVDFAAFVSFFPQLVAGPIVRAREFIFQLEKKREFSWDNLEVGLTRFLYGYFMKTIVADNLGVYMVDPVFAQPGAFSGPILWFAIICYSAQVYADFSGYSSMAIGSARMLGFRIPENFAFPYVATSIAKLWRRWHMTMSRFFRDYVYIGLGGNRYGALRTMRNLAVTTFVVGLWHGAGWTYVTWGLLQGVLLVINQLWGKLFSRYVGAPGRWAIAGTIAAWVATQIAWLLSLVVFRSASFAHAWQYLRGMMTGAGDATLHIPVVVFLALGAAIVEHFIGGYFDRRNTSVLTVPARLQAAVLVVMILILHNARPPSVDPFIYFQF